MRQDIESPFPYLERRFGEKGIISSIEELSQVEAPSIELADCAYHMGYLEEAAEALGALVGCENPTIHLIALCLSMWVHVAIGDAATACACVRKIEQACGKLPTESGEASVSETEMLICARTVEDCLMMSLDWVPGGSEDLAGAQQDVQVYCGYQMAVRTLGRGGLGESIGVARSFAAIAGDKFPVTSSKLRLIAASAYLRLGKPEEAAQMFREAWNMAHPLGVVMPFIEMSMLVPGLVRHCLHDVDEPSYLMLRALVQRYRKGWHGLRVQYGASSPCESLSVLEYAVGMLAVWGWRNREIALYLRVTENTVKHYLTNVYQKLDVKNRSQLVDRITNAGMANS